VAYGTGFTPKLLLQTEKRLFDPAASAPSAPDDDIAKYDEKLIAALRLYKEQHPAEFDRIRTTLQQPHVNNGVPEWTTQQALDAIVAAQDKVVQLTAAGIVDDKAIQAAEAALSALQRQEADKREAFVAAQDKLRQLAEAKKADDKTIQAAKVALYILQQKEADKHEAFCSSPMHTCWNPPADKDSSDPPPR